MARPAFVAASCIAAGLMAAWAWWPAGEQTPDQPALRVAPAAAPSFPKTDRDRIAVPRTFEVAAVAQAAPLSAAPSGDIGQPLDPDGDPAFEREALVADVGELLDPALAPRTMIPLSGPTDVGETLAPEERP